jgi:hypothetical protein
VAYVHERVEVVRFGAQGRALLAGHGHVSGVAGRKSLSRYVVSRAGAA